MLESDCDTARNGTHGSVTAETARRTREGNSGVEALSVGEKSYVIGHHKQAETLHIELAGDVSGQGVTQRDVADAEIGSIYKVCIGGLGIRVGRVVGDAGQCLM